MLLPGVYAPRLVKLAVWTLTMNSTLCNFYGRLTADMRIRSALCTWHLFAFSSFQTCQKSMPVSGRLSEFLSLRMVEFTTTRHRLDLEPSFLKDLPEVWRFMRYTGDDQNTESRVTER